MNQDHILFPENAECQVVLRCGCSNVKGRTFLFQSFCRKIVSPFFCVKYILNICFLVIRIFYISTTPVQALKHCARLLRRRSQRLPFALAFANAKAGDANFPVATSTYRQTGLTFPLSLCFYIVSYTHFLDFFHDFR